MAPIPDPINEFISPKWDVGAAIGRPRILSFVMRKTAPFRAANGRAYTFIVKNLTDSSLCNSLEFVFSNSRKEKKLLFPRCRVPKNEVKK